MSKKQHTHQRSTQHSTVHWVPGVEDTARHASTQDRKGASRYADGSTVATLCGKNVTAENGTYAWLWLTCHTCNIAAHDHVGSPLPPGLAQQRDTMPQAS